MDVTEPAALLRVEPLHRDFGARIAGVDLAQDLDDATTEAIRAAIDEYSFVCFPGQDMNDERHLAFTRALGELENNHIVFGKTGKVVYFGDVGNVLPDGAVQGNADERIKFLTANEMWHTDSSFREVPSALSVMAAYEVPKKGGQTQYASTRAAYARLPAEMQAEIDPLIAIHDYLYSRTKVAPVEPGHAATVPPVKQKLVRRNPRSGAKNYFVGSHARAIVGWDEVGGRALLDDLTARATVADAVYTHAWRSGDLVVWDNRCLLHRGTGYDADRYRRRMRFTRVSNVVNTLKE
jgi:alpha-ketoglutarate-dependent 2,4-dichlorophenoxyacetate dioxygenase